MRKTVPLLLFFLMSITLWAQQNTSAQQDFPAPQKFALVIGNADYTGNWRSLNNPVNDAIDMAAGLEDLGFEVELITNGSLDEMDRAVLAFRRKLIASRSAYGFFYYAGHGAQYNDKNYLIPVEANTTRLNHLAEQTLEVSVILQSLESAGNQLNMIVLDACRDLPENLQQDSRGGNEARSFSAVERVPPGSLILYATATDATASDGGNGRNGLFTSYLLGNLKTPGLTVQEIFTKTSSEVARATQGRQYPEFRQMFHEIVYLNDPPASGGSIPGAGNIEAAAVTGSPVPAGFIRISGGTFNMGSLTGGDNDERPVHTVTVSSFYLSRYEVTQQEWTAVMAVNPSYFKGDKRPVEMVSWFEAVDYCNRLSRRDGLEPAYTISGSGNDLTVTWNRDAGGYRLPTEAEWEFAARGGNGSPGNFTFSGSNNPDEVAWHEANSGGSTQEAGTKKPNALGLYDMSGNVWEWCWDWFGIYPASAQSDPQGALSGSGRVARGSAWINSPQSTSSTFRSSVNPFRRNSSLGFRLARSFMPPE